MTRRYVVVGAGAIGGSIGGLLALRDVPAVVVARGDHLDRMRGHGLQLRMPDRDRLAPVEAIGDPAEIELTHDDVLVLATKSHQAEAALAEWADAPVGDSTAGQELPVLIALNGVSAEFRALRWFRRVYGVCVWMPAARLTPGEIFLRGVGPSGVLHLGRVPAALTSDRDRALLDQVAGDWTRAGLRVGLPDDVLPWKYRKLLSNLGNAVQALLGSGGAELAEAARDEAMEVFTAAGVTAIPDAVAEQSWAELRIEPVPGQPEGLGGSTWQSLVRRTGTTEADFLNGEVVSMAHGLGRSAPLNAALARLTRNASRTGRQPGDLTAAELRAELEGDT